MAVDASLDSLRKLIGAKSTTDDDLMTWALEAVHDHWRPLVYADHWHLSDVQQGLLLHANRLYRRRVSATGVEGFGPEGFSVRVIANDPDVGDLMAPHLDMTKAGVA